MPSAPSSLHDSAAVLSIGDELTLGQKLDTNSQWISEQLVSRGVAVREHVTIADDLEQNVATFRRLAATYPLIVVTGGLGPTADDLTRQALAQVMGETLVEDEAALAQIRGIMERRGRKLGDNQRLQALRPASASIIENPTGTAPGLHGVVRALGARDCDVFCLPGPPGEMHAMFKGFVLPRLRTEPGRAVITRVLHCLGIGEGDLATRLGALMARDRNPLVGTTASGGVVSIRIRYEGESAMGEMAVAATERESRDAAGPFVFGEGEQTIEGVVIDLLRARRETLVVAESCTGGGLGALVTRVSGASDVFAGGWIAYANQQKTLELGVDDALIAQHGAVSAQVAQAMAHGALRRCGAAQHALSITGVAGPSGGSAEKPVGTVFVGRASRRGEGASASIDTEVRGFLITGGRADIRDRSAKLALMMLRFHLLGQSVPNTLWQIARAAATPPDRA